MKYSCLFGRMIQVQLGSLVQLYLCTWFSRGWQRQWILEESHQFSTSLMSKETMQGEKLLDLSRRTSSRHLPVVSPANGKCQCHCCCHRHCHCCWWQGEVSCPQPLSFFGQSLLKTWAWRRQMIASGFISFWRIRLRPCQTAVPQPHLPGRFRLLKYYQWLVCQPPSPVCPSTFSHIRNWLWNEMLNFQFSFFWLSLFRVKLILGVPLSNENEGHCILIS